MLAVMTRHVALPYMNIRFSFSELHLKSMCITLAVWMKVVSANLLHKHVTMTDCRVADYLMPEIRPETIKFTRCSMHSNICKLLWR